MSKTRISIVLIVVAVLMLGVVGGALAATTTKTLSTNFTLVNLGAEQAVGTISYLKENGTAWPADAANSSFTLAPNGGQVIIRQYQDTTMTAGKGSAVVSSSQPLAAVVQIRAIGQVPSEGAYSGYSTGSGVFYVPLVARQGGSASGTTNSQIIIQNTGSANTDVEIQLTPLPGFTGSYLKTITGLLPGQSYYYELDGETNLPTGWYGSATVTATTTGGLVSVVSNFFLGADALQSFNAFPQESLTSTWLIPLFTARLANGLSTPVTVQNLSGGEIAVGDLTLSCTKDPTATGAATLTVTNATAIPDGASYAFNPVSDTTNFPAGWYGSCKVDAGAANVVAFVQMRYVGVLTNLGQAAYEGIPGNITDVTTFVPLIAKRLGNGFATAVTIQNLDDIGEATVDLTYVPSPSCPVAVCDKDLDGTVEAVDDAYTVADVIIPAGGSIIRNHRLQSGFPNAENVLPEQWLGSLKATADKPIASFVQLTYIVNLGGDTFQAHNGFGLP